MVRSHCFQISFSIFLGGNSLEKEKVKTLDVEQSSIPSPPPINTTNHNDTSMDESSLPTIIISNENTPLPQAYKCKQPGRIDSLGMFLPSKNMLAPSSPPNFISSKPMKVFGKTFPKYERFPVNTMNCQLDVNGLHMTLCAYAIPPVGFKSHSDVKEGIPVNGTAPRLIFYNDKNTSNLNMDSKYIKRLVQFGLLFLSGNPHLLQEEKDMMKIFTKNPELEYPWNDMWELFENFEKRKIRNPTPNYDYTSADLDLHENESEKTFPKYERFPVNTMDCPLDANGLHMILCGYAFPPVGFKSHSDVKEGIPVNGTAPRLIFYNDKNTSNLNMDSKYIKRLVQFGLLFLSGNPHLLQEEKDMMKIFTKNPELEYPWNDMWELFENFEKRKIRNPTPNYDYTSADLDLHENESDDESDVGVLYIDEEGRGSQDSELLAGSVKPFDSEGSDKN